MDAVDQLAASIGVAEACRVLGVPRSHYYRVRQLPSVPPLQDRPLPARSLSVEERIMVRETLNSARFQDCAPREVYATLLDEGTYLCSWRTMYHILAEADEVRERRDQVRRPAYTKPELLATRPRELWSWDITKLKGPTTWTYYYLYVILDVFSRYVVGFLISERETAELAEAFIAETCTKEGIDPNQLTLHADRGSAMTSKSVAQLLADLGVTGCPLGVPFAAARLERQSLFGGTGRDAEISPWFSGPIRQLGRCPRVGASVLSVVQP
jgi:putative transposase